MYWSNFYAENPEFTHIFDSMIAATELDFYRTRNPLSSDVVSATMLPFFFPTNTTLRHRVKVNTKAFSRGETNEHDASVVCDTASYYRDNYTHTQVITVFNTVTNPEITALVVEKLVDRGWAVTPVDAFKMSEEHQFQLLTFRTAPDAIQTVILTNELSNTFMLRLGAILPNVYGITINEEITQAYLTNDEPIFIAGMQKLLTEVIAAKKKAEQEQMYTKLEQQLNKYTTVGLDRELAAAQDEVRQREEYLRQAYLALQEAQIKKFSTYWEPIANSIGEFILYLRNTAENSLEKINCPSNIHLDMAIRTKLLYWEEARYDNLATSSMNNCVTRLMPDKRALVDNIFKSKSVNVLFYTGVRVNLESGSIESQPHMINYRAGMLGMPHIHTIDYDCFGNNRTPIMKAVTSHNYIIMWEQIKVALSNINIPDGGVFEAFINRLFGNNKDYRCLELADTGEILTPEQFLKRFPNGYEIKKAEPEKASTPVVTLALKRKRMAVPEAAAPEAIAIDPVVEPIFEDAEREDF